MRLTLASSAAALTAASILLAAPAARAASGLDPIRVKGAKAAGAAHAARVPVTLVLAPRDPGGLARAAAKGSGLTPARFNARFAPSTAGVKRWARANDLRVESVSANRLLVRVSGSPTAVGKAFHTSLRSYTAPDGTAFFAPATKARAPKGVKSVLGLSNLGRTTVSPPVRKTASAPAVPTVPLPVPTLPVPTVVPIPTITAKTSQSLPSGYGPQALASLYNAPASATGAGQSLAVIAQGDLSQPQRDLVTFEDKWGLPHVAWHQVNVGTQTTDTAGAGEWDLDTQYSTGMAPGVTDLYVYVGGTLSNDDILATINRWVTDNTTRQASFSAGECELLAYATGFTDGLDVVLQQAAAQGQTIFFSSGDTGIFCYALVGMNGVPAGLPSVAYPASSPYGIGIGGTTVLGPGPQEVSWYAGGGGVSYFEPLPSWQTGTPGVNRGVPDVALDADPLSGYLVIVGGQEETIGGTSASAPAWQGIWARAQGARGGGLGFAGPPLYRAPAAAFHDVVVGANPAPATPGWDYTTGRGTPDISALISGL